MNSTSRIEQVIVSLSPAARISYWSRHRTVRIAADIRPLIRLNVSVILEQDGQREQGYSGGGARCGPGSTFIDRRLADRSMRAKP